MTSTLVRTVILGASKEPFHPHFLVYRSFQNPHQLSTFEKRQIQEDIPLQLMTHKQFLKNA